MPDRGLAVRIPVGGPEWSGWYGRRVSFGAMTVDVLNLSGAPTPLQRVDRLGRELGFAPGALLVKRDDLTAFGVGGNKARKLDHLCADALARGCRTLVTGGAAQSNHVRMTAAAAAMLDLKCVVVLGGREGSPVEGNLLLDRVFGARTVFTGASYTDELEDAIAEEADRLEKSGEAPYLIPLGGSSPIGALGYVDAAREIVTETDGTAGTPVIYTACGSGGTHAGLVAGMGDHSQVVGVDVGAVRDIGAKVSSLARSTAQVAGLVEPVGEVRLAGGQVGAGYGAPTPAAREAIYLAARSEGIVLDPVYSAKALAGLIADRRCGRLAADRTTVFVHTGGLPALFTSRYRDWLSEEAPAPEA